MWQAAHSALLMLSLWLIASAAVLPLLELPWCERDALLLSITCGAYSSMIAVVIQAATGVRAISPDVLGISLVAFVANLLAVLGTILVASLTVMGAWNALRTSRREPAAELIDPARTAEPGV